MDKIDFQEKKWGFVFGIIAMAAAIVEMIVNGICVSSVMSAIKDVFGTLVVVVVFYYMMKNAPKKPKNITEVLEKTIEDWGLDNAPLIFKAEGYISAQDSSYEQGFVLLQEPKSYPELIDITPDKPKWIDYAQYKSPKRLTGKFLDMPAYKTMTASNFDVLFVMEQTHFKNMENLDEIIKNIEKAVNNRHFDGIEKVNRIGNSYKLKISYKQITTDKEIEGFRDCLDFVLSLVKVIA